MLFSQFQQSDQDNIKRLAKISAVTGYPHCLPSLDGVVEKFCAPSYPDILLRQPSYTQYTPHISIYHYVRYESKPNDN